MNQCRWTTNIIVVLLGACVVPASAQDSHYWNLQYGTRAELLGGAVIGSKVGLSNTYYNPGALALLERPSLVLSSLALELTTYDMPRDNGPGLSSTVLSTVPNFVAGTLWFRLGGGQMAYSFLTRQELDVRLKLRAQEKTPGVGGAPDTSLAGEIVSEAKVNENWVGLTWSSPLRKGLGIGLTQYVAFRSQRTRGQLTGQESTSDGNAQAAQYIDDFDFWHVRTLTKLGILYEASSVSFGVTVTTPSLGLLGEGSVYTSLFDPILDDPSLVLSAANYQEKIDPDYQSSWAIGGGMSYQYGSTRLHASVEWYAKVDRHVALATQPITENLTGLTLENSVFQESKAITNFGLGLEHVLNPRVQVFISGITNFSANPDNGLSNMASSTWDIYQFTGGSNFTLGGIEFTIGVEYGAGNKMIDRVRITDSEEGGGGNIVFEPGQQEVRYRRLEGFLGFTFLFGEDPKDKPRETLGAGSSS
jgi:hypothetical protein